VLGEGGIFEDETCGERGTGYFAVVGAVAEELGALARFGARYGHGSHDCGLR
jgi:hypothetical protein